MKKAEALQIAPERSKLLCEYIIQILSDKEKITGEIRIDSAFINNERMLTFDIFIPNNGYERHFNTGITTQQVDVLTEQIFNDLTDNFLELETIGCTRYYFIRGGYGMDVNGVDVMNNIGSRININFVYRGDKFNEQVNKYNSKLDEYAARQEAIAKIKR